MPKAVRRVVSGLIGLVVLSACGATGGDVAPPRSSSLPTAPSSSAAPDGSGEQADFKFPLPVQRKLVAGSVTLVVTYSSSLPANEWRAGAIKPMRVVVTAYNTRNPKQDVYLQRLTINATPRDKSGPTEEPKQTVDASEINPGYYFRSPTTYNQIFVFPSVDPDPTFMSFEFTYEILVKIKAPRDYAKQTGEDTLRIPLLHE